MFKINNKNTTTMSDFVDFEQVNISFVTSNKNKWKKQRASKRIPEFMRVEIKQ